MYIITVATLSLQTMSYIWYGPYVFELLGYLLLRGDTVNLNNGANYGLLTSPRLVQ
jgi:hypothetical protein